MKRHITTVLLFFSISLSYAQSELQTIDSPYYIIHTFENIERLNAGLTSNGFPQAEAIFAEAGVYKIRIDEKTYDRIKDLQADLNIVIYKDQAVDLRELPNDPGVSDMWSIDAMKLDAAWNFDQDGKIQNGDEIVIAIIDKGYELEHEDLRDNVWVNKGEIPNNGIDDDKNGLVDDYNAWDFLRGKPYLDPDNSHGSPIAGIIGAVGNNKIGTTGIMWHPKMMNLGPASFETDLVAALNYIYRRRKAYNESRGKAGDFVVAVNCSWGWNDALPDDYPGICSAIDELGKVGVLVITSVTNDKKDVDEKGDMPAACRSDNLISVTAIDIDLNIFTGYGKKYVDIAAPGDEIFTTAYGNEYRNFSGTSAAAPHITGAVGFLYDIACEKTLESMYEKPAQLALIIKNILFDKVRRIPSFEEKLYTEGIVDLRASALEIKKFCGDANIGDLALHLYPNPSRNQPYINVEITHPDFKVYKFEIFDAMGQFIDEVIFEASSMSSVYQIDISRYQSGVYFIRLFRCQRSDNPEVDCSYNTPKNQKRYLKNADIVMGKFIVL